MDDQNDAQPQYQVLARKYRPATFADLIGQEAMVRTLKNAFAADRIAHAFILTGVRGVGKTTTARIVAKGLNCTGPDGQGGPTIEPCGQCEACVAIAEGRHVDVMEMDAASRTGVGDIREIIDSVNYRAASARYKVYIIDEVHMLSNNAFNALLKTLEEPPAHVKFIFATTEIRKVPVTVLSRCQRFDLRRIEPEDMIAYLNDIAGREGAVLGDQALGLITRAAEGSMRDALSILDQAIAHGAGETSADQVRAMLGLADRGRILDLFDLVMKGDAAGALAELSQQYADGADPMAVLRDLAEVTHWVSVVKISPETAEDPTVNADERARGLQMADALPMRVLSRAWQMLLKALEEVAAAPNAMMAAEMAIIRLTHVADLPTPGDLVAKLTSAPAGGATGTPAPGGPGGGARAMAAPGATASAQRVARAAPQPQTDELQAYQSFEQVVGLIRRQRDMKLLVEVETYVKLVEYTPGRIEFEPADNAPPDLAQRLAGKLQEWTGRRWGVTVVSDGGGETIAETEARNRADLVGEAMAHPMLAAVLQAFPGVGDKHIKVVQETAEASLAPVEEPEDADDDWDPFED
ncbi:DNA polymerase III subunit gamma/tau [Halovulum sp. GXIMD14793]